MSTGEKPSKWGNGRGGRPWRRTVERIKARDQYTCQECGRITQDGDVDHKVPLSQGGPDTDDNLQYLCRTPCHQAKTAAEGGRGTTHPSWIPKPACRVVLVTGPAGGGKTTYCKAHAGKGDDVIDLDECYLSVCGVHGHEASKEHLDAALRLRNMKLAALAHKAKGTAYFIVASPTREEERWWIDLLGAEHVLCDPGKATAMDRVTGRRRYAAEGWYTRRMEGKWKGARPKQSAIGVDGWPL